MVTRPSSNEALYVNVIADRIISDRNTISDRTVSECAVLDGVERQVFAGQEELLRRILPDNTPDAQDRAHAWAEWQAGYGEPVLARYVRAHNNTLEADDDIIQDTLITAYL